MYTFENKNVFIIGGSGFIGTKITEFFLNHNSIVYNFDLHDQNSLNNYSNYNYQYYKILGSKNDILKIEKTMKISEVPDIYINCSYPISNNYAKCAYQDIDHKNINENLVLHLGSYVNISNFIAKKMKKQKTHGKIILFSSIYGMVAQDLSLYRDTKIKDNLIYPIIKSGIISLTKQLASIYGMHNINVNCISPGGIVGYSIYNKKSQDKKFINKYKKKVPLNRMATQKDLLSSIAFLASDDSEYITGHNLVIDGGYTII